MSGRISAERGVQKSWGLDPMAEVVEEDLAKVDSLVDRARMFAENDDGIERVYVDLDDDDGSTLVGVGEVGEKEVEVDITDDEGEGRDGDGGGGRVKRRRTIRVVIRSRAFL